MGRHFRHVGEKIALGPHVSADGRKMPELFFDFHSRYFYYSRYYLIARNPAETVMSMSKMFPDKPLAGLVECWLDALRVQLDVLDSFPNAHSIFFERFNRETLAKIAATLGLDIRVGTGTISNYWKATRLEPHALPPALAEVHPVLSKCDELYYELMAAFCPDTFALLDSIPQQRAAGNGFMSAMRDNIDELLAEINRPRRRVEREIETVINPKIADRMRPSAAPAMRPIGGSIPNLSLDESAYMSDSATSAGR
jgi:hypothetical protein